MNFRTVIITLGSAVVLTTASAQVALYSNGSLDPNNPGLATGAVSGSGVAAPAGSVWSEAPSGAGSANAAAGFSCHQSVSSDGQTGAYRLADNFTVPPGHGWRLDYVSLFAYQPNAGVSTPFAGVNVRVWSGRPGDAGSVLLYGDATTNRLISSTPTNIYRIYTTTIGPIPSIPDTTKRVWRADADLTGLVLHPGSYWLDWQFLGAASGAEAFCPPVTIPGTRGSAGWDARQYKVTASSASWVDVVDLGKPIQAADVSQDFAFILHGGGYCPSDIDDGSGTGVPDGGVTIEDLLFYLVIFDLGDIRADLDDGSGLGTPDGGVTIDDLLYFLTRFEGGC